MNKCCPSQRRIDNSFRDLAAFAQKPKNYKNLGFLQGNIEIYQAYLDYLKKEKPSQIGKYDFFSLLSDMDNSIDRSISPMYDLYFQISDDKLDSTNSSDKRIINNTCAQSLTSICDYLSTSGFINYLLEKHNHVCTLNDLDLLTLSPNLMDDELRRYSTISSDNLTEVCSLYAFWLNKLIKFVNSLEEASMYFMSTAFMDEKDISKNERFLLVLAQKKKEFLSTLHLNSCNSEILNQSLNEVKDDYSSLLSEHFNGPTKYVNNINLDNKLISSFESCKSRIYKLKDFMANEILKEKIIQIHRGNVDTEDCNWGISPIDSNNDLDKAILTVHLHNQLFPIACHVPKLSIEQTLSNMEIGEIAIPYFDMNDYFSTKSGNLLPINVLYSPESTPYSNLSSLLEVECAFSHTTNPIYSVINFNLNKNINYLDSNIATYITYSPKHNSCKFEIADI